MNNLDNNTNQKLEQALFLAELGLSIIPIGVDKKPLARVMSLKLNSAGYSTSAVFSGEEALASLSRERFDLIILDLMMTKKDGFYVLSELNKAGIQTPVIITSNLAQKEDIEKAKKLGVIDYFVKSDVTLVEMVNKVKQYLQ